MKFIDLTGQKFGRLTVIKRAENTSSQNLRLCQCDCGNTTIVHASKLKSNHTRSCGCYKTERAKNLNKTHGMFGRLGRNNRNPAIYNILKSEEGLVC